MNQIKSISDSNISLSSLSSLETSSAQSFHLAADHVHVVYRDSPHELEDITPYEGYSSGNLPGISSVLFFPYELCIGMKHLSQGRQKNDHEGVLDNTIRLLGMPFSIIASIDAIILTYDKFINNLPPGLLKYLPGLQICGLILCLVEMCVELVNLKRTSHLRDKILKKPIMDGINTLWEDYLSIPQKKIQEVIDKVNKSSQGTAKKERVDKVLSELNDKLRGQKTRLARRIGSWLVKEIDTKIDGIYKDLHNSCDDAQARATETIKEIIKDIDIQTKKKMIIHIIGIIALAITIVAIIAFLVGCPYVAVAILFGVGMAFGIARYVAYKGYFGQSGWNFSKSKLLPEFLQKKKGELVDKTA